MSLRGPIAAGAIALGVAFAGCGGDEPGSAVRDAIPADAAVYVETVVRPEGEVGDDLDALLERFGAESPGPLLIERLDESLQEDGSSMSYADDIEPWLGERAAFWFAGEAFAEEDGDEAFNKYGAFVVETTDEDAARDFLESAVEEGSSDTPLEDASHEGYEYFVDGDGVAGGVVDGLVVFGGEPAFQAVIDTVEGADGLAADDAFADALPEDDLDDSLASLYVDTERAIDESGAREGADAAELEEFERIAPQAVREPVVASLELEDETVALDASYGSFGTLAAFIGANPDTEAIAGLPEGSWGAVGYADLGEGYLEVLREFSGLQGVSAGELDAFEREINRQTGLTLDRALRAIGDAGLFIGGESLLELGGGAVIEIRDEQAGDEMFSGLEQAVATDPGARVRPLAISGADGFALTDPDVPQPVNFVREEGRWVIAYGDAATEQALEPSGTLADSPTFASAEDALGDDVVLNTYFEIEPILALLTASPAGLSGDYVAARPYLEHLDYVAIGGGDDGETGQFRLVVGTK